MNIEYTIEITELRKAPLLNGISDVVTEVHYKYTGTHVDSGIQAARLCNCILSKPSDSSFTKLEDPYFHSTLLCAPHLTHC